MKMDLPRAFLPFLATNLAFLGSPAASGEEKEKAPAAEFVQKSDHGRSIDPLAGKWKVDAALDSPLFKTFAAQYLIGIGTDEEGEVISLDGEISFEDLKMVEKTARCESTSQGGHTMVLSNAVLTPDGVQLAISSGAGPYPGELVVEIGKDGTFKCSYSANYITPPKPREWRFLKKSLTLRSDKFEGGKRLYGWLSVEFEEVDLKTDHKAPIKIEGFFKPVVQTKP